MPSKKDAALDIKNVSVDYGGSTVIHDIDLQIKSGEFFGLMGLNGAGKTSLIKAVLGLKDQKQGDIKIYGDECTSRLSKSQLAFLPERFEPPWFLSGMEFIQFSLKLYGTAFDKDKVMEYAARVDLDPDALKRRVQTYSKGMRQKLGLMATVLTGCRLLILDEPMSGLDPKARTLIKDLLVESKSEDHTIFLSSHILVDMDEICDRVGVLHEGVLQFVGTPTALKKKTGAENLERAFLHFIEHKIAA